MFVAIPSVPWDPIMIQTIVTAGTPTSPLLGALVMKARRPRGRRSRLGPLLPPRSATWATSVARWSTPRLDRTVVRR
jgi:hypothetical protein